MIDQNFAAALPLLKMALPLLDKSVHPDATVVACHVQAAIDLADGKTEMTERLS